MRNFTRIGTALIFFSFFFLIVASCDLGMPASIGASGTPGIHFPLGSVFTSMGQDNKFLDQFFNTSILEESIKSNESESNTQVTKIYNYIYDRIAAGGAVINGSPHARNAVQTYMIIFPVAEIPIPSNLPAGWTMPTINFYGPSFESMLGALLGIKFRYMQCYMLIEGISNTNISPARITLVSGGAVTFLANADLVKSEFQISEADEEAKQYSAAITGTSTGGFSLIPLFSDTAGSSPMNIIITSAQPSGTLITVKMLIVLPLTFEVPPETGED